MADGGAWNPIMDKQDTLEDAGKKKATDPKKPTPPPTRKTPNSAAKPAPKAAPRMIGDFNSRNNPTPAASPSSYKKGGKVKKTGVARVHKGETVLTAKEAKKYVKKKGSQKRISCKG